MNKKHVSVSLPVHVVEKKKNTKPQVSTQNPTHMSYDWWQADLKKKFWNDRIKDSIGENFKSVFVNCAINIDRQGRMQEP